MILPSDPTLKMKSVSKVYGNGSIQVRAVDDVDLVAWPGKVLLIMGPSGSGKTTLITLAGALLRPTSGSIKIDGEEIATAKEKELTELRQKKIGFIFQSFNLLANLSALENVLVPLSLAGIRRDLATKKALGLLRTFGLEQRADFRPEQLSGGEKQRVSIARSLCNDPKLILADEPTANLDSSRGREVTRILSGVAKNMGKTVIIVSHDERVKAIADRILWLEDGRFKESEFLEQDPICGMRIEKKSTTPQLLAKEKTYYFCSQNCKKEFEEKLATRKIQK